MGLANGYGSGNVLEGADAHTTGANEHAALLGAGGGGDVVVGVARLPAGKCRADSCGGWLGVLRSVGAEAGEEPPAPKSDDSEGKSLPFEPGSTTGPWTRALVGQNADDARG